MSAELGVVLGPLLMAVTFFYIAFQLMDTAHEAYALFAFLLGTAVFVAVPVSLQTLAEQPAFSSLEGVFSGLFVGSITFFLISLVYFILRVMVMPAIAASKGRRLKLR